MLRYCEFIKESSQFSYSIPTYEQCRKICDESDNFIFFESKHQIDGYNISIFNYRLASYNHFENPIKDDPTIKAHELRGLTFVFNKDGSVYKRFLLLDKFFNLDQTPCSMYSVVKDFKIKNIFKKEDGSVASFIELPNGKIIGKSKSAFISEQAVEIQKILDTNPLVHKFVKFCLSNNINPIFEYVSPTNRIVIPYANTQLILLRLRDNMSGEYLDIDNFSQHLDGISVAESESGKTLTDLIEASDIIEGQEGWVVQFENGKMIKIKSKWYQSLHSLFTDELNRENVLINLIISEQIDDVLAQFNDDQKRAQVDEMASKINNYIKRSLSEIDQLLSKFNGSKKDFALTYQKHKWFNIAIGSINGKDKIEMIKSKILSDTRNLQDARKWISEN